MIQNNDFVKGISLLTQDTLRRYRGGRNGLCGPTLANERELRHQLGDQPQKITAVPYIQKQAHKQESPEDIGGG